MDDMITLPDTSGALLAAIRDLVNKIDNLDISVDYLAAAVTGQSAMEVGGEQSMLGRMASPISNNLAPLSESQLKQMIEEVYAILLEDEAPALTAQTSTEVPQITLTSQSDDEEESDDEDPNLKAGSFDLNQFKDLPALKSVSQNINTNISDLENKATLGGALGAHVDLGGLSGGIGSQSHTTPMGGGFQFNVDLAKLIPENKLNKIIEEELQGLLYERRKGQI